MPGKYKSMPTTMVAATTTNNKGITMLYDWSSIWLYSIDEYNRLVKYYDNNKVAYTCLKLPMATCSKTNKPLYGLRVRQWSLD